MMRQQKEQKREKRGASKGEKEGNSEHRETLIGDVEMKKEGGKRVCLRQCVCVGASEIKKERKRILGVGVGV